MSIGFAIAIRAVPFFDLLDREEESLAAQVVETTDDLSVAAAMDAARRHLAQGVNTFVRSLPGAVRNDVNTSRAAAYALVALADERMLHHPAGGLNRWRERLLEYELYGSALAGQEIVTRARAAAYGGTGTGAGTGREGELALLAPLYLGVMRAGFEGSLRGDIQGLSSLMASLEESIGSGRDRPTGYVHGIRPKRVGVPPLPLAVIGILTWLVSGFGLWLTLPRDALREAERIAEHVIAQTPVVPGVMNPLERSVGPSDLPASTAPTGVGPDPRGRSGDGGGPEEN